MLRNFKNVYESEEMAAQRIREEEEARKNPNFLASLIAFLFCGLFMMILLDGIMLANGHDMMVIRITPAEGVPAPEQCPMPSTGLPRTIEI